MYQALYRKYRPAVFDDVCGQKHITDVLQFQAASGRISHAYLFCGSRGTGKTTCAKIFAKAINCEHPVNGNPCGECLSCRSIDEGTAPDFLEMDAASNNGVEYIRAIREEVAYTPSMLKRRVYIVDEVHMLSTNAFNALLKTLEEPPEHVVFILATTEMHKLPTTIISRCQRYDFRRIRIPVLAERLHHIAEAEGIRLDKDAAQCIAKQAQGGMRDAISLFELCSGGGADVTLARTQEVLGLSGYDFLQKTAEALSGRDMQSLFSAFTEINASSKDVAVFWQELASFYRDMLVAKHTADVGEYLDLTEQEAVLLNECAKLFNAKVLAYHCTVIDEAMQAMQKNPAMKRVIAEFACLRMCEPAFDMTPEALAARIGQLEDRLSMLEISGAVVRPAKAMSVALAEQTESSDMNAEAVSDAVIEPYQVADDFVPVTDFSELLEKLSTSNPEARSFVAQSRILVSSDGAEVMVICPNSFVASRLSGTKAKEELAAALVLCRITNRTPVITVSDEKRSDADDSAANDLYSKI